MKVALRCAAGLLIVALACPLVWAADPEIAVWEYKSRKTQAVVMGADGSNPTPIFERKFSNVRTLPSWSPLGDWVAIRAEDNNGVALYKVRVNGSELTKVLCSVGTDIEGEPFDMGGVVGPQWSPDGDWILVKGENWLGIVGADDQPGANCHSNLIVLYEEDWDGSNGAGWWMQGTPAWNHDGSRIAVFEFYEVNDTWTDFRLQILEVAISEGVPAVTGEIPVSPIGDLPQTLQAFRFAQDLDWQRQAGDLLTFDTREGEITERVEWVSWINSVTGQWGHLTDGSDASWSPENGRIVCSRPELTISDVVYDENGVPSVISYQNIGSGRRADWKRDPLPEEPCVADGECDDFNPCTGDSCVAGECHNDNLADFTPCGDYLYCSGGEYLAAECDMGLPACDDGEGCTIDTCVDYQCSYDFDSSLPNCGGAPGDPCTIDADCLSGLCHPKKKVCK